MILYYYRKARTSVPSQCYVVRSLRKIQTVLTEQSNASAKYSPQNPGLRSQEDWTPHT